MPSIERVEMPDGTTIYVRVEENAAASAGVDVGLGDRIKLDSLGPTISSVASSVHDSVKGLKPDRISVEFGVELSLDAGRVVAVLASGSVKAALKIQLDWDLGAASPARDERPRGL